MQTQTRFWFFLSNLPLDPIYLRFYDMHLQGLYIMVIIRSYPYISAALTLSAAPSLPVILSPLSDVCFSRLLSLSPPHLVPAVSISMYDLLSLLLPCFTNIFTPESAPSPNSHTYPVLISHLFPSVFAVYPALPSAVARFSWLLL